VKSSVVVLKDLYGSNFKRALKHLTEIEHSKINRPELIEKAQSLRRLCERKLDKSGGKLDSNSPEVIYDHGIFCHNNGDFDEALDHFKKSLAAADNKLDYVYYAMAATQTLQGQNDQALTSLKEAIKLNENCRIHASNDPDFVNLGEDEEFRALIEED